jgi:hypothetical protein
VGGVDGEKGSGHPVSLALAGRCVPSRNLTHEYSLAASARQRPRSEPAKKFRRRAA